MKVWELMQLLSKMPAGAEVAVTAYPDGTINVLQTVDDTFDEDMVVLKGNGRFDDDRRAAA